MYPGQESWPAREPSRRKVAGLSAFDNAPHSPYHGKDPSGATVILAARGCWEPHPRAPNERARPAEAGGPVAFPSAS